MTLKQPVGKLRTLVCDQPGCGWEFVGTKPYDRVPMVRHCARQRDWLCDDPGPGKPARDLCPRHRPKRRPM